MPVKTVNLDEIEHGSIEWRVRVRIIRMWHVPAYKKPEIVDSLEMILLDQKSTRMHATVKKALLSQFEPLLKEGDAYYFENLLVAMNDSKSKKHTAHKYRLGFLKVTIVGNLILSSVPKHHFNFASFSDILDGKYEKSYFDVIAQVVKKDLDLTEKVIDGKKTNLYEVLLEDQEGTQMKCSLWAKLAEEIKEYLDKNQGECFLIVQFCQTNIYKGIMGLTNAYHGTKLYINSPLSEIQEYKERLASEGRSVSPVVSSMSDQGPRTFKEDLMQTPHMTISDLIDSTENCCPFVLATIIELADGGWYYQSCTTCYRKCYPLGSKFYCEGPRCERERSAVPRFKVTFKVMDQTGSTTFTAFDRVMTRILGKSATDLLTTIRKKNVDCSQAEELKILVGKRFLFKVENGDGNIGKGWRSYNIKEMIGEEEKIVQFQMLNPVKDSVGDDAELTVCGSQELGANEKDVEEVDSNIDVSNPYMHHSTNNCLVNVEVTTPTSTSSGKRSGDIVECSETQTSSTKVRKVVEVKMEPIE